MGNVVQRQSADVERLLDTLAIENILAAHSRGIDRNDEQLLRSCYHPDATVDYGMFEGKAWDFCKVVADGLKGGPLTMHRPSNNWIKINGDKAIAESYVVTYMRMPSESGMTRALIGGRYLDRLERRDGSWKLCHRIMVLDWNSNHALEDNAADKAFRDQYHPGGHRDQDESLKVLNSWTN